MVADAKECGEGVSFFGVRRLLLADVPLSTEDLMQRVGRAVRFMGHASLPPSERTVEVRLYVASLKDGATADEALVERLRSNLGRRDTFEKPPTPSRRRVSETLLTLA